VDGDFGAEDDKPFFAWLPPEDRLWRHPSEAARGRNPGDPPPPTRRASLSSIGAALGEQFPLRGAWTVALVAGAIGALTASGIGIATGAWTHKTTVIRPVIATYPTVSVEVHDSGTTNWSRIEDSLAPSVVGVQVSTPGGSTSGSGLLLFDGDAGSAYVVTDRSLFASSTGGYSAPVEVTSSSGSSARATLIGQDPQSGIALLSVPDRYPWIFAPIGSIGDVLQASPVLVMGAPQTGGQMIDIGTVTSTDQEVNLADGGDIDNLMALATPSSNSGAVAVDQNGRVIGVTVKLDPVDSQNENLTFAVPIDEVVEVARQIVANQRVEHPWLGLSQVGDLPTAVAKQEGIPGGASVFAVAPSSPASRLGIASADVIISLNGTTVQSAGALQAALDRCPTGKPVQITFMHDSRVVSTTVRLTPEPQDS
jgi:S1-C subfamily serine protease